MISVSAASQALEVLDRGSSALEQHPHEGVHRRSYEVLSGVAERAQSTRAELDTRLRLYQRVDTMTWVRTPSTPPQALVDEIRPGPVRRFRVVAAMVAVGVAGPIVGAVLSDGAVDRGLVGLVVYDVALAAVAAGIALRSPSRVELGWFVTLHRVALTARNGTIIVDYLARTRRWRAYGVVGSVGVAQGISLASPATHVNGWAILFAGWFVGGILAEVPVGRRHVGGLRVASLQPRTLSRYLSPGVTGWLLGWAVGTVGVLAVYGAAVSPLGTRRVVGGAAVRAVVSMVSVWSMLVIVRRPQPAAPPDVVAADDATRRAAVRRIAAGWGVLQCIEAIVVGQWLSSGPGDDLVADVGVAACVLGLVGVLASWLIVPTRMSPPRDTDDRVIVS